MARQTARGPDRSRPCWCAKCGGTTRVTRGGTYRTRYVCEDKRCGFSWEADEL